MENVTLVDFILLMCSLGGPLRSEGFPLYLVGVCFGESWYSVFTWCCFYLLTGSEFCWRCYGCFLFLYGGWDLYPLLWF